MAKAPIEERKIRDMMRRLEVAVRAASELRADLKPIADRCPYKETQDLAKYIIRTIDTVLGDAVSIQIAPRHHA